MCAVACDKSKRERERDGTDNSGNMLSFFYRIVLKSIGYKSIPVDGLPFDHRKGM